MVFIITIIYLKVPKDVDKIDLKNPQEMAYVFSGAYTPISCRLVEQVNRFMFPLYITTIWESTVYEQNLISTVKI